MFRREDVVSANKLTDIDSSIFLERFLFFSCFCYSVVVEWFCGGVSYAIYERGFALFAIKNA